MTQIIIRPEETYIEKLQRPIPRKSNVEGWNQEKKVNYTKDLK